MKRLLITGGRGFIGRHCLSPAIAAGYEVHALASSANIPNDLQQREVTWHVGNLLDQATAQALIKECRPTHVLHAAWITTHGEYWTSAENLRWLAVGTRLLEAFSNNGGKRFVSVGSCAEYEWGQDRFKEGETPERPSTFYGALKFAHHLMLNAAARNMGFSAATGRIFFAYGPYENANRVIPYACQRLNAGLKVRVSKADFWRDFMYISDVANGLIALLDSDIQGACNVCSGAATLLSEIIIKLGQISGHAESIQLGAIPNRSGEPAVLVGTNQLLRTTGWAPQVSLEDGLSKALGWWRSKGLKGEVT